MKKVKNFLFTIMVMVIILMPSFVFAGEGRKRLYIYFDRRRCKTKLHFWRYRITECNNNKYNDVIRMEKCNQE